MLRILLFFFIFPIVTSLSFYFLRSEREALGVLIGATLMGLNVAALTWAWRRIFVKKSIALAASVIVIKYAIIGFAVYKLMVGDAVDVMSFVIGITTIILGLFLVAVDDYNRRKKDLDGTF